MSKVQTPQDTVDHAEAKSHQGIDTAQREPIQALVEEVSHAGLSARLVLAEGCAAKASRAGGI